MECHYHSKKVRDGDAIEGTAVAEDGTAVPYTLWGMKEPEYVIRVMVTSGAFVLMTPAVRQAGGLTVPHLSSNTPYPTTGTSDAITLLMTTTICITVFLCWRTRG